GPRAVPIEPARVRELQVTAPPTGVLCANDDATLVEATVTYVDGKRLRSARTGSDDWIRRGQLAWSTDVGAIDGDGWLTVPADRTSWLDRAVTIGAAVRNSPTISNRVTLTPRYDCGRADLRGGDGGGGQPGARSRDAHVALTYLDAPGHGRMMLVR